MLLASRDEDEARKAARQRWGTPPWVVAGIERLTGTRVTLDVCAEAWSAKAERWYGPGSPLAEDALAIPASQWLFDFARNLDAIPNRWRRKPAAWCNPTYSAIDPWVDRVIELAPRGLLTWLLVPFRSERGWVRRLLDRPAFLTVITGDRIDFEPPPGIEPTSPMGSVVIFQVGGGAARLPVGINHETLRRAGEIELEARRAAA